MIVPPRWPQRCPACAPSNGARPLNRLLCFLSFRKLRLVSGETGSTAMRISAEAVVTPPIPERPRWCRHESRLRGKLQSLKTPTASPLPAHRHHAISDRVWLLLEPLLPGRRGIWGGIAKDNRLFINAVFWILRIAAPSRDLPPDDGNWKTRIDAVAAGGTGACGRGCSKPW